MTGILTLGKAYNFEYRQFKKYCTIYIENYVLNFFGITVKGG